jgi:cytosine/uracil/thiamine/allantoin permease
VVQHDNYEKSVHEVCYFGVKFWQCSIVAVSLLLASDDRIHDDLTEAKDPNVDEQVWVHFVVSSYLVIKGWLVVGVNRIGQLKKIECCVVVCRVAS